ncbi:MAG: M1 family metallopeptidase [Acidobacteriota bacterium]
MRYRLQPLVFLAFALLALGCAGGGETPTPPESEGPDRPLLHSFARPGEVTVEHLDLTLAVDFEEKVLSGRASLRLPAGHGAVRLVLDTRDLTIDRITLDDSDAEATFELGEVEGTLGRPLTVEIAPDTGTVHVDYRTDPAAAALLWLGPEQTAGGSEPFLFTQSQAILARTWVPIQDTPAVRFTYSATVRVPPELLALMSAENPSERNDSGEYRFEMPQPIPSYLLALAVGDLAFEALDERSGVYAEPSVVEAAAWEFADIPAMIDAAEALYGPYRWGQFDVLVLPPSFPFGGMENPRLTFATPTILAGDRSLVSLIAHELAHSWSGNLATNADWNDFWLNEGFTTYFEGRLMEEIEGEEVSDMLLALGYQDLLAEVENLTGQETDTHLRLDLAGRDPDDGMTNIAYEKGRFLLRYLEQSVGREAWDGFLRTYFDRHAFRPVTTETLLADLENELLAPGQLEELGVRDWIFGPGIPDTLEVPVSERFEAVDAQLAGWLEGSEIQPQGWSAHEWLRFLRGLPEDTAAERLAALDQAFQLTDAGNSEIAAAWFVRSIDAGYEPAYPAIEDFLKRVGRRKFLVPIYGALAATPEGLERARRIYGEARAGYHAVSQRTLDEMLGDGTSTAG